MKEGMVDIRPKLFEHEGGSIDTNVDTHFCIVFPRVRARLPDSTDWKYLPLLRSR
jgi:hypothetical protein